MDVKGYLIKAEQPLVLEVEYNSTGYFQILKKIIEAINHVRAAASVAQIVVFLGSRNKPDLIVNSLEETIREVVKAIEEPIEDEFCIKTKHIEGHFIISIS